MKTTVTLLAIWITVSAPVSAQVPCPIRIEPDSLAGILNCNDKYSLRESLQLINVSPDVGYRTVAEFSTIDVMRYTQVYLIIEAVNNELGGPDGSIRIDSYWGDGVVTVEDYWAGFPFAYVWMNRLEYCAQVAVDVLPVFRDAYMSGEDYVGFQLSAVVDRYGLCAVYLCIDSGTPIHSVSWGRIKGLHQ
jgi:hypothetical protein